jgi:hypothetical protein
VRRLQDFSATTILGGLTKPVPSPLTVDVSTISNSYVTASETSYVTASGDDWVTAAEEFSHIDTHLSVCVKLSRHGFLRIFGPSGQLIIGLQYLQLGFSGRALLVLQNKFLDVRRVLVRQREAGRLYSPLGTPLVVPNAPDDEFLESVVDMTSTLISTLKEGFVLLDARPVHLYRDDDGFIISEQFDSGDTPRFKLGYH